MTVFIIGFDRTGFDIDHCANFFDTREEAEDAGAEFIRACDKIGMIDPPNFKVVPISIDESSII